MLEHEAYFVAGEHDGQARSPRRPLEIFEPGWIDVEDVAIEEDDGAERLF